MEKKLTVEKNEQSNSSTKDEQLADEQVSDKLNGDEKEAAAEKPSVETEIQRLEAENKELKDKFLRKVAEFENYKRRIENEQINFFKYANENLIKDLLTILDDFERSLNFTNGETNQNNVLEGIKLIRDKFQKILLNYGLRHIEALNKPFDFHLHEALLQVPKEGVPPHTVIEEVEKGYMLKDKVIRHTKVIVSSDEEQIDESKNDSSENRNEKEKE
ncbi:MAG: nucleotide exchange factor GrpE [Ignavibacteria bacterium]|nr:nucleotide exchange factor GrpE [Ignavibacteria bacterium]